MLKGIMDDPGEGHAFLIGFGDGVAFKTTDWKTVSLYSEPRQIEGELHYYKIGLAIGRFAIIGFVTGMIAAIIVTVGAIL